MEQHDDEQQNNLMAAVPMPTSSVITAIPDDVLADVFRRMASPRGLALCRCVCRAWRALIDERPDLLPLSLPALLLCLDVEWERPELFARPGADVTGHLMPPRTFIEDHCNGLVLNYCDQVINPATRQMRLLPECPPPPLWNGNYFFEDRYLAFDPAESPHYQVFCIPVVRIDLLVDKVREEPAYRAMSQSEWPPSPFVLSVFSSATGRWEGRSLVRRGGAAGTFKDMENVLRIDPEDHVRSACWRGALYVHSTNDFILRLPLSSDHTTKAYYQVIKRPAEVGGLCGDHLGKSKEGVYFAAFDRELHLCVWILHDDDSSCGHMEWILKHRSAYGLALPSSSPRSSSWTLNAFRSQDGNAAADAQEWDSDDDGESTLHTKTGDYGVQQELICLKILAFHPYREIAFMFIKADSGGGVVYAYHLNTSKLEDLGSLFPKDVTPPGPGDNNELHSYTPLVLSSFPYTPCWMGMP